MNWTGSYPMRVVHSPMIGGTFAEPATEYPRWFDTQFFRRYPYVLPGIVSAFLAFLAAILSITFLREVRAQCSKVLPGLTMICLFRLILTNPSRAQLHRQNHRRPRLTLTEQSQYPHRQRQQKW